MSYNTHALYMFATFSFMAMLPFQDVGNALVGAAIVTTIASLTPGSTAFVQDVERAVLGN